MNCTRDTYLSDWDSNEEMIDALQDCGCLACEDRLKELRGEK